MTADDFRNWRKTYDLSRERAAARLGISYETVRSYEAGRRGVGGGETRIPDGIALACHMISLIEAGRQSAPPTPLALRAAHDALCYLNAPEAFVSIDGEELTFRTAHEGWQVAGMIPEDLAPLIDVLEREAQARREAGHDLPSSEPATAVPPRPVSAVLPGPRTRRRP